MKDEDFDNAIKRKVENINYQITPNELDRLHKIATRRTISYSIGHKATISYIATSVLVISGLLTWNIKQAHENHLLIQTIDCQKKKYNYYTKEILPKKTDTIYITRYISRPDSTINHNYVLIQTLQEVSGNSEDIPKNNPKKTQITESTNKKDLPSRNEDIEATQVAQKFDVIKNDQKNEEHTVSAGSDKPVKGSKTNFSPTSFFNNKGSKCAIKKDSVSSLTFNNTNDSIVSLSLVNDNLKDEFVNIKYGNINDSLISPYHNRSVHMLKDTVTNSSYTIGNIEKDTSLINEAISHKPGLFENFGGIYRAVKDHLLLSVKKLKFYEGIGAEISNVQSGYNADVEILLSKHLGLYAGFQYLTISNEHFNTPDDFNIQKDKNFLVIYNNHLPNGNMISNINIRNTLFQIPVKIELQIPLKNDFTLLIGPGTDIDLFAVQQINYLNNNGPNLPDMNKFVANYQIIRLNNLILSTGVQKKSKHFVFEVSPFISLQLIPVPYKTNDDPFGLDFHIFYAF